MVVLSHAQASNKGEVCFNSRVAERWIEGEFGIHRQLSDGNLHIYVHQGLNCLPLEQVTHFSSLEIEKLQNMKRKNVIP